MVSLASDGPGVAFPLVHVPGGGLRSRGGGLRSREVGYGPGNLLLSNNTGSCGLRNMELPADGGTAFNCNMDVYNLRSLVQAQCDEHNDSKLQFSL